MADSPCPTCEGFGKVASSNGKSWLQFAGKPYGSPEMTEVREGNCEPRICPDCKGSGVAIDSATQANADAVLQPASPAKRK